MLDAVAAPQASAEAVAASVAEYGSAGRASRLLPRRLTRTFGRESVLRRYARYSLDRRR